jgi:hypothetical protein
MKRPSFFSVFSLFNWNFIHFIMRNNIWDHKIKLGVFLVQKATFRRPESLFVCQFCHTYYSIVQMDQGLEWKCIVVSCNTRAKQTHLKKQITTGNTFVRLRHSRNYCSCSRQDLSFSWTFLKYYTLILWQIDGVSIPRQRIGKRLLTLLCNSWLRVPTFPTQRRSRTHISVVTGIVHCVS